MVRKIGEEISKEVKVKSNMAGARIEYDNDEVEVFKIGVRGIIYVGLEKHEPMKNENWEFIVTDEKRGLGHYQFGEYIKINKRKRKRRK